MKKSKKFLKVLSATAIAAIMATTMASTAAFAANASITLNPVTNKDATTGIETAISTSYKYYKVFDGNYNVTTAFSSTSVTFTKADNTTETVALSDEGSASKLSEYCADTHTYKNKNIRALADALAETAETAIPTGTTTASTVATTVTDKFEVSNYYLIVPEATAQMAIAPSLLYVTGTSTVTPKTSSITVDKAIEKVNSATTNVSASKNTATVGKDDVVSYSITSQIPNYATGVERISQDYKITDKPSNALDIQCTESGGSITAGITVKVDNANVTADADTYSIVKNADGGFTVTFVDSYVLNNGGKEVVVSFDAKVNENVVDGKSGNNNQAVVSFDNDYTTGSSLTPKTIDETVKVYTTKMNLIKNFNDKDGNDQGGVAGAKFTLYKDSVAESNKIDEFTTTTAITSHEFVDLAEGTYVLVEDEAPVGYAKIGNITFNVSAGKDTTSYEYDGTYTFTDPSGSGVINFALQSENTYANGTVTNTQGQSLPGTGGVGTTMFTIGGIALVVVAGGMLTIYMKKRKTSEEE